MPQLLSSIAMFIERHAMFRAGQSVGVAVSGGADSACLLHILLELAPAGLRLRVIEAVHSCPPSEDGADWPITVCACPCQQPRGS